MASTSEETCCPVEALLRLCLWEKVSLSRASVMKRQRGTQFYYDHHDLLALCHVSFNRTKNIGGNTEEGPNLTLSPKTRTRDNVCRVDCDRSSHVFNMASSSVGCVRKREWEEGAVTHAQFAEYKK